MFCLIMWHFYTSLYCTERTHCESLPYASMVLRFGLCRLNAFHQFSFFAPPSSQQVSFLAPPSSQPVLSASRVFSQLSVHCLMWFYWLDKNYRSSQPPPCASLRPSWSYKTASSPPMLYPLESKKSSSSRVPPSLLGNFPFMQNNSRKGKERKV